MKNKEENKEKKYYDSTTYILGFILGIYLVKSFGLHGIISNIIGVLAGIFIANKLWIKSKFNWRKNLLVLLIIIVVFIGTIITPNLLKNNISHRNINYDDVKIELPIKDKSKEEVKNNFYRNNLYNFRIFFPKGWKIEDATAKDMIKKAVSKEGNLSVSIYRIKTKQKIDSIKDFGSSPKDIATNFFPKTKGMKILNYGETKIGNYPAYWTETETSYQSLDYKTKHNAIIFFIIKNNILYMIGGVTEKERYTNIKPILLKSIQTFFIEPIIN